MIYGIDEITVGNKISYDSLFNNHFTEQSDSIREFIKAGKLKYYIYAKEKGQLVGAMGILDMGDYYAFFHLVVHEDHRGKGIATGIIRMAIKFLIDMGATKIRNHKRENIIPHRTFKELGFKMVDYRDEEVEYKWTYELDVSKADINMLNNFWSKYDIS